MLCRIAYTIVAKIKWLWLVPIATFIATYIANITPTPIHDFAKGFPASVLGWLFIGPYALYTYIVLGLLIIVPLAAWITTRALGCEEDKSQDKTSLAQHNESNKGTIQQGKDSTMIGPGSTVIKSAGIVYIGNTSSTPPEMGANPRQIENRKQEYRKAEPAPGLLSNFTKELDDLINRLPNLQTVLQDISDSFNNRIYSGDCNNEHARLTQACQFICDFSAYLSQSASLPSDIDSSSRIRLLNELKGFEKLVKATGDDVSAFCANYGAERVQPPEYRMRIQLQINELKQSSKAVLNKAQKLRETIHG